MCRHYTGEYRCHLCVRKRLCRHGKFRIGCNICKGRTQIYIQVNMEVIDLSNIDTGAIISTKRRMLR